MENDKTAPGAPAAPSEPATLTQLLSEARRSVPEITARQAKRRLDAGEIDLILDVREPDEYAAGHIPGALLAPRGQLEFFADPGSDSAKPELIAKRNARIVVQCQSGGRSLLAAQTLKKMGYTNVTSMVGGIRDWNELGYPVEREPGHREGIAET